MGGDGQFYGMNSSHCDTVGGMILALNALYLDEWRQWYAKAEGLRWEGDDRAAFMNRLAHIDSLIQDSSDVFSELVSRLDEECAAQDKASEPDEPTSPFPFPLPFPLPGEN